MTQSESTPTQAATAGATPHPMTSQESFPSEETRAGRLAWFKTAQFGLFLHYGLYSLLGRGEWVQFHEQIPVAEYAHLAEQFTADRFDANRITDLAVAAGMRYINITTRHHDSFCLWNTATTDFNSFRAAAGRDLVAELAEACAQKKIGLFLYYSHGRDWRHPFFPPNEVLGRQARPHYNTPEPAYEWRTDADTEHYVEYCHEQLKELLSNYGPIAGIWFDGVGTYKQRPELFHLEDTYRLVRELQPGCLISYKNGATGDEDFFAPERGVSWGGGLPSAPLGDRHIEICDTMLPKSWGHVTAEDRQHHSAEEVLDMLRSARKQGANLLLNTGPLGDGSIYPHDERVLREVGASRHGGEAIKP